MHRFSNPYCQIGFESFAFYGRKSKMLDHHFFGKAGE
jgi:hypothetical protein